MEHSNPPSQQASTPPATLPDCCHQSELPIVHELLVNGSQVCCTKPSPQQWRHFRGLPPPLCQFFLDMDTGSESEGGPWSDSSATTSNSDSPSSGDSPRTNNSEPTASPKAAEGVVLTPYEASRLQNIERNNKKLQDLGLPTLVSQVGGAEKAGKEILQPEAVPGLFSIKKQGVLPRRVTRSIRAASPTPLLHLPDSEVRFATTYVKSVIFLMS